MSNSAPGTEGVTLTKRLIRQGFPGAPYNMDAAFVWSGNGRIYFIKGKWPVFLLALFKHLGAFSSSVLEHARLSHIHDVLHLWRAKRLLQRILVTVGTAYQQCTAVRQFNQRRSGSRTIQTLFLTFNSRELY